MSSFVEVNRQRELFELASQEHDNAMVKYSKTSKRRETDKVSSLILCSKSVTKHVSYCRQDLKLMLNSTWPGRSSMK